MPSTCKNGRILEKKRNSSSEKHADLKWCTVETVVSGEHDPDLSGCRGTHHVVMLQSNRSFWSFISKISIQRAFFNPPKAFVEVMYSLAIEINAAPSRTPITVVWDTDLPHFDSTRDSYQDESHLVAFSCVPFSPDEIGSLTA
jgi:hypothetical protein